MRKIIVLFLLLFCFGFVSAEVMWQLEYRAEYNDIIPRNQALNYAVNKSSQFVWTQQQKLLFEDVKVSTGIYVYKVHICVRLPKLKKSVRTEIKNVLENHISNNWSKIIWYRLKVHKCNNADGGKCEDYRILGQKDY